MRFSINSFTHASLEVNLVSGLIIKGDLEISIRAKTLNVLKFLILNKDEIVTKEALLNEVWHDVVVQEQVLVQSIKEIRNLLGSKVIKTYPRQGYQWVAEITQIDPHASTNKLTKKPIYLISTFCIAALILLILYFFIPISENNQEENQRSGFTVAFLPVENAMPDDIHNWVPLEGMDYLSQRLKQQSQLTLVNNQTLLNLVDKINDNLLDTTQLAIELRKQLPFDLLVKTRLLGYPQDFQLHYTLYLPHNIERGIEFADSVDKAFEQLIAKIAQRFGQFIPNNTQRYQSDFGNEAFARGIELYLQRDFINAIAFFTSALTSNQNLLVARRYLAASYINNGNLEQGIRLMQENIKQAQQKKALREEIRSNLMIGVLLLNKQNEKQAENSNLLEAEHYIQLTKSLAEQYNDSLFIAYAHEELAKIKHIQKNYAQAISLLKIALEHHQNFRGNYGQTNTLIELARIASSQGKEQQANDYFAQATTIANENGVATNKVAILLSQAKIQQKHQNLHKASEYAQQALNIAQTAQSELLITQVKAWFSHNNSYEIN